MAQVMSKAARMLLNKIKEYVGNELVYDVCDIEWYAHRFLFTVLDGWWKSIITKSQKTPPPNHTWFLPFFNTPAFKGLLGYAKKSREKISPFEFEWNNNTKQVYHYLCSNYLNCDFNINEFKKILELGEKYKIGQLQAVVEKKRNGVASIDYLAAILGRDEQAKDIVAQRVDNKIAASQTKLIDNKRRPMSRALVALMKTEFQEIKLKQDIDNMMKSIRGKLKI